MYVPTLDRECRAALEGPVFITDRGRPAHVLLSIEEYRRLTGGARSFAEALSQKGLAEIPFTPEPARIESRAADLS